MKLNLNTLKETDFWQEKGISVPKYDVEKVRENTVKQPKWVHFGVGNIFRMFIGSLADTLLEKGESDTGINCVESFDFDIIDKIYKPHDNLALGVTLLSDGKKEMKIIGSLSEALTVNDKERLKEIFTAKSLQMVSFTITEKGYKLKNADGEYFSYIKNELENAPELSSSAMGVLTSMLYERFKKNRLPLAVVSMDNCSHNGEMLKSAVLDIAENWVENEFCEKEFLDYLEDETKITFPWTMIDKITPRPSELIAEELDKNGIEGMKPIVTSKNTYIAPFVNAEKPQYLVIEDKFPAGRPLLESAGVYMTDRETVNKTERMKVTTCLNPLHTALAVLGCLLGYKSIADEMKDEDLNSLVRKIGLDEGLPVVTDPKILSPKDFVNEVIEVRLPNPFVPDTPQRIATDTSQKVGIRFGETIKAYCAKYGSAENLDGIAFAIASWCRYLLGVDDNGDSFAISADPMLNELKEMLGDLTLGSEYHGELNDLLSNANVFGINLYEAKIGKKIEKLFAEEIEGKGAVRKALRAVLNTRS